MGNDQHRDVRQRRSELPVGDGLDGDPGLAGQGALQPLEVDVARFRRPRQDKPQPEPWDGRDE